MPESRKLPASSRRTLVSLISPITTQAARGYESVMKLTASRLPQMAAALSYRTIFGLIPVIVVGLVTVTAFATPEDIRKIMVSGLDYAGLTKIALPEMSEEEKDREKALNLALSFTGQGQISPAAVTAGSSAPMDPSWTGSDSLDKRIAELVANVTSIPFGQITAIGILTLIYAAISMFIEIEHAFNQIFRVPDGRSFMRRVVIYWTMLTLGSLGLVATFYVGEKVKTIVGPYTGGDANLVGYLVSIPISTAILLVAYTAIPNTRIRFLPALAGAFIAAVMFEAGKLAFSEYVRFSAGYARLYGSLALIPLFLLWVYVTWLIVLSGLQFTYRVQHGPAHEAGPTTVGPMVIDPGAGAAVLGAAAVHFREGRGITALDMSKETGLSEAAAGLLAERLASRGFLHRVAPGGGSPAPGAEPLVGGNEPAVYALARPPELIPLADVLRAGFELADESTEHRAANPVQREIRGVQLDAAQGRTLASAMAPATPGGADISNPGAGRLEPRVAPAS